jgi:hypothetical protein
MKNRQVLLSVELPIDEHQHLHWNCLLVKSLAFEPTTQRKFFGSTGDALIFQSDDNDILAARLVPNSVSGFKIGAHSRTSTIAQVTGTEPFSNFRFPCWR